MKQIHIMKNKDFSVNSRVFLHVGDKKFHIKGYKSYSFHLEPGQEFFASHQWTRSNRILYNNVGDGSIFLIRPRLTQKHAYILLLSIVISIILIPITRSAWSFAAVIPINIYILSCITILKNRYLIIKPK